MNRFEDVQRLKLVKNIKFLNSAFVHSLISFFSVSIVDARFRLSFKLPLCSIHVFYGLNANITFNNVLRPLCWNEPTADICFYDVFVKLKICIIARIELEYRISNSIVDVESCVHFKRRIQLRNLLCVSVDTIWHKNHSNWKLIILFSGKAATIRFALRLTSDRSFQWIVLWWKLSISRLSVSWVEQDVW